MNGYEQGESSESQLPAKLSDELKSLYGSPQIVPPHLDESILAAAREHLSSAAQSRRIVPFPRWLAAVAVVALAAVLGSLWFSSRRWPEVAREDINRDGRVDVLDAFALARRLHQGVAKDPWLDINGDGIVNQKDIEAITTRVVKLDGRRG